MILCILLGVLLIALGAFLFFRPDLFWKLTEKWKSYSADEPSDFYRLSTKVGGALFVLLGVAMCVLPLILE